MNSEKESYLHNLYLNAQNDMKRDSVFSNLLQLMSIYISTINAKSLVIYLHLLEIFLSLQHTNEQYIGLGIRTFLCMIQSVASQQPVDQNQTEIRCTSKSLIPKPHIGFSTIHISAKLSCNHPYVLISDLFCMCVCLRKYQTTYI